MSPRQSTGLLAGCRASRHVGRRQGGVNIAFSCCMKYGVKQANFRTTDWVVSLESATRSLNTINRPIGPTARRRLVQGTSASAFLELVVPGWLVDRWPVTAFFAMTLRKSNKRREERGHL